MPFFMILKGLMKLGLSGGAMAGAFTLTQPTLLQISEAPDTREEILVTENNGGQKTSTITEIQSLKDIDLFAKEKGCTFTFVSKWNDKQVYNAEAFIAVQKDTAWPERILSIVKSKQEECKDGKIFAFSWKDNTFKVLDPKKQ